MAKTRLIASWVLVGVLGFTAGYRFSNRTRCPALAQNPPTPERPGETPPHASPRPRATPESPAPSLKPLEATPAPSETQNPSTQALESKIDTVRAELGGLYQERDRQRTEHQEKELASVLSTQQEELNREAIEASLREKIQNEQTTLAPLVQQLQEQLQTQTDTDALRALRTQVIEQTRRLQELQAEYLRTRSESSARRAIGTLERHWLEESRLTASNPSLEPLERQIHQAESTLERLEQMNENTKGSQ